MYRICLILLLKILLLSSHIYDVDHVEHIYICPPWAVCIESKRIDNDDRILKYNELRLNAIICMNYE